MKRVEANIKSYSLFGGNGEDIKTYGTKLLVGPKL